MSNSVIRRVVILGALAIMAIVIIQSYWVLRTWDIKEQEFNTAVNIALRNTALQLDSLKAQSSLPAYNLISQEASNYYVVNINDEINANLLEYYLKKNLEAAALRADFEYGIYDCYSKDMVYGNYIGYSKDQQDATVRRNDLPTYDDFEYYFGVRFPNRSSDLLGAMRLTITFTAILFLAILFFSYSIIVILRQKRLSEMQKDFINNMTHEFKTPISTIKISADVFLNNPLIQKDQRLHQYATIIKDQNQRLNNQVEKVLQLAKIERSSFKLKLEKISLHDLLNNIIESTSLQVSQQKGRLLTQLDAQSPMVEADKLHLTNILHNLLDNAIKYCQRFPEINIRTSDDARRVKLEVADRGIGISKEHQGRVFDKFYRVPTGNVHNVKGFGLGLFYIKNICHAHGWKLSLESEPEVGTTITILMNRVG
ncbi:MAG: HAMP domain-containing sensor histidine kinase [Bacteroidota bacterium]